MSKDGKKGAPPLSGIEAVIVFTAQGIDTILIKGGTRAWRLDRNHARQCPYVVCTRNAHGDWVEGTEPHHSAFLIAKVRDVVRADGEDNRWVIQFSEYARVDIPDVWQGERNPVKYVTLDKLTWLDPKALDWKPMPQTETAEMPGLISRVVQRGPKTVTPKALTMAEAKKGLAITFGVPPEAIEITVRG